MRKWHRWLGIVFALFLTIVSVTGVAIHVEKLINTGSLVSHTGGLAQPSAAGHAGGPQPDPRLHNLLKSIHDGTFAGTFGAVLSILTGLVLLFFALSGVWMYVKMWETRKSAGRSAFFWKR